MASTDDDDDDRENVQVMPKNNAYILIGTDKLCPAVVSQHVENDHLAPLFHIHQQVAQFSVILVYQVYTLWADFHKGLDSTACHQLHSEEQKKYI